MTSSSDNSFIPKRGPVKHKQKSATRQLYIFTYISYILMFATLLSTGGVFIYGQYIDQQRDDEIAALNAEISSFSGENLATITDFDLRLQQANQRLENSVSIASVFEALQSATIDTVQIKSLNISREDDDKFILTAAIETDSFDSTIFQRGEFGRSNVIGEEVLIENVITDTFAASSGGEVVSTRPVVNFSAILEVPLSNVPYAPTASAAALPVPITMTQPETETETEVVPQDAATDEAIVEEVNNDSL